MNRFLALVLSGLLAAFAACARTGDTAPPAPGTSGPFDGTQTASTPLTALSDGAAEEAVKVLHAAGPGAVRVPPLFDSASADAHARVAANLSGESATTARGATLPVLVPARSVRLDETFVTASQLWVSAQTFGDGFTATVFGTVAAHEHPAVQVSDDLRIDENNPLITISEGIPSIAFSRFGVAWRLELECERGPADPRCGDAAFLHELYDGLAVLEVVP